MPWQRMYFIVFVVSSFATGFSQLRSETEAMKLRPQLDPGQSQSYPETDDHLSAESSGHREEVFAKMAGRTAVVAPVVRRSDSSNSQQPTANSKEQSVPAKNADTQPPETPLSLLEAANRELTELRKELRAEFQAVHRDATFQGSSRARHVPELERLRKDLDARSAERESRVQRMRDRVQRLEDLLRDAPSCQPTPVNPEPVADTPPLDHIHQQPEPPAVGPEHQTLPAAPSTNHKSDASAGIDHNSSMSPHATAPVASSSSSSEVALPDSLHERLKNEEDSTGPEDSARSVKEMIAATTITDHPIDRVGLANNLYGTGEIQLALEIYQKIPLEEQNPSDRLWIQYQIANCHRRLGNDAEAARGFRIVTSQDSKSWIGKFAVWWLNSNSKIETAQERLNELNRMSEVLKEPVRANGNP